MTQELGTGARIAALRARRGLTQEELAGLAGMSVSLLRKIEQGIRPVTKFSRLLDIAQALRVRDLSELTGVPLTLAPDGHRMHPAVPAIRTALTTYRPSPDTQPPSLDDLSRRANAAWQRWQQPGLFRIAQTGQELPKLVRDIQAASGAAPSEGPERRRVRAEEATVYQLVRTWCKRVGEHDLAWIASDRAIHAAHDTDDPDHYAAANWNIVSAVSAKGLSEVAMEMAVRAIDELRPHMDAPPTRRISLWGALHLRLSWQAARGDDDRTVDTALSEAQRAAAATQDRNDYWTVFGPTNVDMHRVSTLVELGQVGRALRVGEQVRIDRSPSVERRLNHYLSLALAYTRRKEDVAAVTMLGKVEQESREEMQMSPLVRETIRELMARETPTVSADLRPLARLVGVIE